MNTKQRSSGALFIILACVAWSFSGVLSKWSPWSAFNIIGARALFATLVFGVLRRRAKPAFTKGNVLGALGVMSTSVLFIVANKMTSAANAIVLQYAMPVVIILAYWIVYKQKPSTLDAVSALVILGGVVLCFMGGLGRGSLIGDALALLSSVSFALVFFSARLPGADALEYGYLGNMMSCLFLLFIPFDPNFSLAPQALISGLCMGVSMTLGYLLFAVGMRAQVHPVTAAIVANVEPVLNPIWAFLFLGEDPGLFSILGAALVILSVTAYSIMKNKAEIKQAKTATRERLADGQ